MEEVKVLLINPPLENMLRTEVSNNIIEAIGVYPSMGLLYIATYLKEKADFKVKIKMLDCVAGKITYGKLGREIREFEPDIIGVTTSTPTMVDVILTTRLAKKIDSSVITVLGGHHVYCYPRETLMEPSVDFIIRGEGERSFLELVRNILKRNPLYNINGLGFKNNGSIYLNEKAGFIEDLDSLPIIDRTMIDNDAYRCVLGRKNVVATFISSRGCPYECTFCYSLYKSYRMRSIQNILEELRQIVRMGIKEVFFIDDLFNINAERVIHIAEAIISNKLNIRWSFRGRVNEITDEMLKIAKKAGCERIQCGIETSSNYFLKVINKKTTVENIRKAAMLLRKNKITAVGSFMIGLPGEDREHILNTFRFARELKMDYIEIGIMTPYPYTKIYRDCLRGGVIKDDFWLKFAQDPLRMHTVFISQICLNKLSQKELFSLLNIGYRQFYMRPGYIFQSLLKTKTLRELMNKIYGACVLLKEFTIGKINLYG